MPGLSPGEIEMIRKVQASMREASEAIKEYIVKRHDFEIRLRQQSEPHWRIIRKTKKRKP